MAGQFVPSFTLVRKRFILSSFRYLKVQHYYYRCLSGQKWDMSEQKQVWPDNLTGASREIICSPEIGKLKEQNKNRAFMSFSRHPGNKLAKTTRKRNLHSVCVLLIHIVVTLRIRIASLSMKLTYIWVKGIHKWRKYGQMITLARCSPFIRFTWHKLATSGFPERSTSRSPKDTCCFECSTGRNTDLKGKKRG